MELQHVLPMSIKGTTLFGLSLDALHSDVIDRDGLRRWVDTLAAILSTMDDDLVDEVIVSLRDTFMLELQAYCLYIASSDGSISDKILEGINWLIGERSIGLNDAIAILKDANADGWLQSYPATFELLVMHAAGANRDILSAGEIYYFYRQVARFVYSIEHSDEFDEHSKACEYVRSYKKYIERVSVLGFALPPESEQSIKDVCKEWDRLVKEERESLTTGMVGTWRAVSGEALSTGDFTDIVLTRNGRGSMGMWLLDWSVVELPSMGTQLPVVRIPEIGASAIMLPLDDNRVAATVRSRDARLDYKTAIYQRSLTGTSGNPNAQIIASDDMTSKVNRTAHVDAGKPSASKASAKVPWQITVAAIAVIGFIIYSLAMRPAKAYEQATSYYESGQYQMAADAYEDLGDYEDAESMTQKALQGVAAKELEDTAGEDPDAWEAAAQAYEVLDDVQGRSEARECRNYATYYRGKRLMSEGRWKEAQDAFGAITETSFMDALDLTDECEVHVSYEDAEALFADGRYYEAYVKFNALNNSSVEGLPDMSERAQACVQELPATGAVYTNPDYLSSAVPLTIKNQGGNTFYKIYDGDTLAMTVFIRSGESASISLPAGAYRMNEAHGEKWFGSKDLFGDEGRYYRCVFGGDEFAELEWGYSYEITASYGNNYGGSRIGNEEVDRAQF